MKGPREILTSALAEEYARDGVVRLPGLIRASDVVAMEATLWNLVERRCGAIRGRPQTWRRERPSKLAARPQAFEAFASPAVRCLLDQLLVTWIEPHRWGVPLVCFPRAEPWDVPHENWHLDLPVGPAEVRVARIFAVLAPSRPHGGATVYAAGSHRVLQRLAAEAGRPLASAEARKLFLSREPWFAALESRRSGEDRLRRFMQPDVSSCGEPLQVREMLGDPGDVILMHPAMLHAGAPNERDTPRMMLTQFVNGHP